MVQAIVIIIFGLSVIQIIRFGWSKLVYNFFSLFLIFLISGRIACEKIQCLWYLPKYLISLVFTKIKCPSCAGYEPDWSLRGGIDEAGLILTGALVFVQVLSIKNIKIRDLVKNIKKVTLLGAFEAELLDQKVNNYSKRELNKIDQDVIKRFEKIEDKIIEKTNAVEERLLLLNRVINEILRELHEKLLSKNEPRKTTTDFEIIIKDLDEKEILDQELIKYIKDFNTIVYTNAFRLNGKRSNSLNIIGSKILKILLVKKKSIFKSNQLLYPDIEKIFIGNQRITPSNKSDEFYTETSILIKDINGNVFPLSTLNEKNFIIEESLGSKKYRIRPNKVRRIYQNKVNLNLILIIDCSTSMTKEGKLEKGKFAAIGFLRRMKKLESINCKILVYRLSSENRGFIEEKWSSIDTQLESLIESLQIGGRTPLFSSLKEAIEKAKSMDQNDKNMIVCLTDGKSEGEEIKFEDIAKDVEESDIPVISIGFGEQDYSDMMKIFNLSGAGKNGKGYFIRANPEEISKIFEQLALDVASTYQIYWASKIEQQDGIKIKIIVKYKDEDGKMHTDELKVMT